MTKLRLIQFLLAVLTVFAMLSCAQQTSPTGGPKDSIPPVLTKIFPADQQTNFQGKQIEATFSEAIQLNNPKEQIIITPGVGKDFQVAIKKNRVVVTFTNSLQPNTTYTVNFREAVQDVTEKNPAQNLHIAFSTGTYIDSLHLFGNVYEILTAKEAKDATVALYEQDTFNIFQHKPAYFTKADAQGNFHIDNLKPGQYRIYAWMDNNKNLLVDSKSEAYGFLPQTIQPQDSTPALSIPLVKLDARPLRLTSARPSQTFFNIKTSKNTEIYAITSRDTEIHSSYGDDHENIRIYNTFQLPPDDSLQVHFIARDSLLQQIDTSLYVKFSQRNIKPAPFAMSSEQFTVSANSGRLSGILKFNKPIVSVNFDSLFYRIDSASTIAIEPADLTFDTTRTQVTIRKQITRALLQPKTSKGTTGTQRASRTAPSVPPVSEQQGPRGSTTPQKKIPNDYELTIATGTFISAELDSSKASAMVLKPTTMESTGVIILEIRTTQKPLLAQLISKGKVIASQPALAKTTFSDLTPGEYSLRIVVDTDQNNRWSPGNIFRNEPPEAVHFYKNEQGQPNITLKANWERELLITF